MKEREEKDKSGLSIRLAEPVIYLKDVDFSGRCRTHNEFSPPSMVRGIMTLNLSKPTKISSISVELVARSSTRWPEGSGARRVEVTEEHQLYSASTVFFRQDPEECLSRRAVSLGPTTSRTTEDDASSASFDVDHEDHEIPHAEQGARDPLRSRRGTSVDLHNFRRDVVSHHATSRIPSPGYIPSAENVSEGSPASSVASLSATHSTPPPDQVSPSQPDSLSRVTSNTSSDQRDHRVTRPGASSVVAPSPSESRGRFSQTLEDFRRALRSDPPSPPIRQTPQLDTGSIASPTLSPSTRSPSNEASSRFPVSRSLVESNDDIHGRRSRFSLYAISDAILDSVKSHSSLSTKKKAERTPVSPDPREGETTRGRSKEKGKGVSRDLSHALIKVSEVFGLEPEEGKEHRDEWKEFKKGTYRYPISFAIPADSPPSLDSMYGSIVWTLTATVHRPGIFTPRMEAVRTINIVATPSEDATEDVESVTVNKTWEDQLVYCLSIVGRAFPIGSKIPIQLTFLPLAKVKIHKVSVVIDEKVTYYSEMQKVAKAPKATRLTLFCLRYPEKSRAPILPLNEQDPLKSPLLALAREDLQYTGQTEEERASELAVQWRGPGPWPLRFNVEISNTYNALRPTSMNRKGNITVSHVLAVMIRVEKPDTVEVEVADGSKKKKVYDIIIQYPIHLLSDLCNRKYTSLPSYSPTWHTVSIPPGQPSAESGPKSIVREVTAPTPEYTASPNPVPLKEDELLTLQFERLVTGQEAETGEPPPSYEGTASPAHSHHPHAVYA